MSLLVLPSSPSLSFISMALQMGRWKERERGKRRLNLFRNICRKSMTVCGLGSLFLLPFLFFFLFFFPLLPHFPLPLSPSLPSLLSLSLSHIPPSEGFLPIVDFTFPPLSFHLTVDSYSPLPHIHTQTQNTDTSHTQTTAVRFYPTSYKEPPT